jgi:two-component system, chemotaxis family, chemotaxis protein CheV
MTSDTSNEQLRELVARADGATKAVSAVRVREVVTFESITRVPGVAQQILGVALVRGRLVPILDLPAMLNCTRAGDPAITRPRLLVLARGDDEAALIADETFGVLELVPPEHETTGDLVRGELRWRTHILALLDADQVIRNVTAEASQ